MLKVNMYPKFEGRPCPCVSYHHYMLRRPIRIFRYPHFPFKSEKAMTVFAKFMAVIHDKLLCTDDELGIQYGIYYMSD